MKPVWQEIEEEISELAAEYYDIDEHPDLLEKYNIKEVPVFIFLDRHSNEFLRLNGMQNKDELVKIIKENLNK